MYGPVQLSGGTLSVEFKSVKSEGDKVVSVHHTKAERGGKTLDADETIEFTFAGDKISRGSTCGTWTKLPRTPSGANPPGQKKCRTSRRADNDRSARDVN